MENELIPIYMKLRVAQDPVFSVVLFACLHLSYTSFTCCMIYTVDRGLVRRVRVGVSDNLEISLDLQTTTHNVCQLSHGLYFKYRVTSSLSYQYRGFSRVGFHCVR